MDIPLQRKNKDEMLKRDFVRTGWEPGPAETYTGLCLSI